MNPALVLRAARLIVVPCHLPNLYHVVGGSEPHIVKRSTYDDTVFFCDCTASRFGNLCSHKLATQWFTKKTTAERSIKEHGITDQSPSTR